MTSWSIFGIIPTYSLHPDTLQLRSISTSSIRFDQFHFSKSTFEAACRERGESFSIFIFMAIPSVGTSNHPWKPSKIALREIEMNLHGTSMPLQLFKQQYRALKRLLPLVSNNFAPFLDKSHLEEHSKARVRVGVTIKSNAIASGFVVSNLCSSMLCTFCCSQDSYSHLQFKLCYAANER